MRQNELRKRFSEHAEFSEGPKLPLHLNIPVLKSFQLSEAKATWPLTRGSAPRLPLYDYVPFSSYGSAALGCTHYWHTSEVINKFRLHRWQWPSADWNGCCNKWKCHWILSVYLCGLGISLKWPYICLCQLLELTINGKSYAGNRWYNFQWHWLIPTAPVLMAVIVGSK